MTPEEKINDALKRWEEDEELREIFSSPDPEKISRYVDGALFRQDRDQRKADVFGLRYGSSPESLRKYLGLPTGEE